MPGVSVPESHRRMTLGFWTDDRFQKVSVTSGLTLGTPAQLHSERASRPRVCSLSSVRHGHPSSPSASARAAPESWHQPEGGGGPWAPGFCPFTVVTMASPFPASSRHFPSTPHPDARAEPDVSPAQGPGPSQGGQCSETLGSGG